MSERSVCVIQHVPCETLGRIEEALKAEKLRIETVNVFAQQAIPKGIEPYNGLIVMGGPMSVNDQLGHLRDEMALVEKALKQSKPILGICLGSQLLASVLGSPVTEGKPEFGWQAVRLTDSATRDVLWTGVPRSFQAFHWHKEVFQLPAGAMPLASSEATECQAFRYGRSAYGILFHMEITTSVLEAMVATFAEELIRSGLKPEQVLGPCKACLPRLHHIGSTVFQRWARLAGTATN